MIMLVYLCVHYVSIEELLLCMCVCVCVYVCPYIASLTLVLLQMFICNDSRILDWYCVTFSTFVTRCK